MPSFVTAISTPDVSQAASEANTPPNDQVIHPLAHADQCPHIVHGRLTCAWLGFLCSMGSKVGFLLLVL